MGSHRQLNLVFCPESWRPPDHDGAVQSYPNYDAAHTTRPTLPAYMLGRSG